MHTKNKTKKVPYRSSCRHVHHGYCTVNMTCHGGTKLHAYRYIHIHIIHVFARVSEHHKQKTRVAHVN